MADNFCLLKQFLSKEGFSLAGIWGHFTRLLQVIFNGINVLFCLQAIKESLDSLQPAVQSTEEQLQNEPPKNREDMQKLVEQLKTDWSNVNSNYTERHR